MFNILILGFVSLLTDISSEMIYPILPLYLTLQLGSNPLILGFIEGIAESVGSLTKVFSGYFSDRVKLRKPFAISGYGLSSIGKALLYTSNTWAQVLLGRFIDRSGKGVRVAPRDALIADSADGNKRGAAFGLHRAMDTLGAVIGVLISYYLVTQYKQDYRPIFLYSLFPALIGVILLFVVREKTRIDTAKTPILRFTPTPKSLVWGFSGIDRRLKAFLVITFLFTLGNSSNTFLLLRAKSMGVTSEKVILLYLVYNLSYFLFSYPAGWLSDKIGRRILMVIGYAFYGLVYLGFGFVNSQSMLWRLFIVYGFYIGITEGVEKAFIADLAPQGLRATMLGMHAALVGIGLLPASVIAGVLWNVFGAHAPFYFGGAMGIMSSISLWIFISSSSAEKEKTI